MQDDQTFQESTGTPNEKNICESICDGIDREKRAIKRIKDLVIKLTNSNVIPMVDAVKILDPILDSHELDPIVFQTLMLMYNRGLVNGYAVAVNHAKVLGRE